MENLLGEPQDVKCFRASKQKKMIHKKRVSTEELQVLPQATSAQTIIFLTQLQVNKQLQSPIISLLKYDLLYTVIRHTSSVKIDKLTQHNKLI
jgi:hypothetical protein